MSSAAGIQVRPGDPGGAENLADAQPLVQVVQRIAETQGGWRLRGGDKLGGRFVHTRSDRPARGTGPPAV